MAVKVYCDSFSAVFRVGRENKLICYVCIVTSENVQFVDILVLVFIQKSYSLVS